MSSVGTWRQRTAQDWSVLAELTRHDASACGVGISVLTSLNTTNSLAQLPTAPAMCGRVMAGR